MTTELALLFWSLVVYALYLGAQSLISEIVPRDQLRNAVTLNSISINLALYGLAGPFAAAAMQRFGVRPTLLAALATLASVSSLPGTPTTPIVPLRNSRSPGAHSSMLAAIAKAFSRRMVLA